VINNKILDNQILASISQDEYKVLFLNLEYVSLISGQVIYKRDQKIDYVYFPLDSMISLVSVLSNKATIEIGLIGNEGVVGLPVFLGGNYATNDTIVQIPDSAMRLDAQIFLEESRRSGDFQRILLLYTQARLAQISQNAVCKCHHPIHQQLACWLLFAHDSVGQDELKLTQKFISQMLGVRRSSVTEVAQKFQRAGIIHYTRGSITILSRHLLESVSCDCYDLVKMEFKRLLDFT
jgi:CRP-like cAMP-binding protein